MKALILIVGLLVGGCCAATKEAKPVEVPEQIKPTQSSVKLTCLDGHLYYYSRGLGMSWLAPKFDAEGKPVKCPADEDQLPKAEEKKGQE